MKVVIAKHPHCFSLTGRQRRRFKELSGLDFDNLNHRSHPALIQVVEEMREWYFLHIVEVPDDVKWHIAFDEFGEWVAEDHRTWGK